jgi:Fe-S cluster biosynthesis and repair protein YggX
VSEEDQMMQRRIEGKDMDKLLAADPFADFGLEKDTQFDQVSKYGIFCSKKEEEEMSKEGVFNYRLRRTMLAIEKFGIMAPQENLKLAKNLALFLIKLTDQHVNCIVETSMKLAQVTSKSTTETGLD